MLTEFPQEISIAQLSQKAKEIRCWIIKMLTAAGSGHPGGSLSCVDILTVLYFAIMRHRPDEPKWPERDRFVLSKGHACPALYTVLALCGYFPVERLMTLRKIDSILEGHPDMLKTPGVEISTGSLGQGLSAACGMALAAKIDKKDWRVYSVLGDGEIQEGQIWEAAMSAANYKLDNICAFLDSNKLQIDGKVSDIMNIEPVVEKWQAFGWHTIEIDGHNITEILDSIQEAQRIKDKPTIIIAHTIKWKGVSFMEGKVKYHGIAPTPEECEQALKELGCK